MEWRAIESRQGDMSTHREPQSAPTESDENLAAWEAGVQRMKEQARARFPELFDDSGELRTDIAAQRVKQYADERGLTLTEALELASRGFRFRADAS
jgi:hypothetical protein